MSKLTLWIDTARPKTLAAAFVPIAVGASLAYSHNAFDIIPTLVALFCAFLIQIATNFANDYFDHKKGADTSERVGFKRASASGLIPESTMLKAIVFTFLLAFFAGLFLVWHGGWTILAIGLLSILFGVLYTGGPYPLAYNGLGDIFVMIFFGLVAVSGTYYVNALQWDVITIPASLAVGALAVNILVVNNLRDSQTDAKVNKRTLGVIFGDNFLRVEYTLMLVIAYAVPVYYYFYYENIISVLLPFLTLLFLYPLLKSIWFETDKSKLNATLEKTAQFMAIYGLLFCVDVIIS